eukprot:scaffold11042_cov137-Isochrysis_galbana.AAC.3
MMATGLAGDEGIHATCPLVARGSWRLRGAGQGLSIFLTGGLRPAAASFLIREGLASPSPLRIS